MRTPALSMVLTMPVGRGKVLLRGNRSEGSMSSTINHVDPSGASLCRGVNVSPAWTYADRSGLARSELANDQFARKLWASCGV